MYIEKVKIENYRALKNVELEFSQGINLIIGDNGTGKTSILEAIIVVLGGYLSGITGATAKGILQTDVRYEVNRKDGINNTRQYFAPVTIVCDVNINGKKYSWERIREDEGGKSRTKTRGYMISKHAMSEANNQEAILPVLGYRSAEFGVSQFNRKDAGSALKSKLGDRRCGYIGCMDSLMNYNFILEWCRGMSEEEYYQEKKIPVYEAFKNCVSSLLQKIEDTDEKMSIRYHKFFKDMILEENGTIKPISELSAGYKAILYLTMDISFRIAMLNPQETDFKNVPGIVLIDELDMHLHPKWQWNVLDALKETFPKVQFIIATHSPIFLSSCKGAKLLLIDDEQKVHYPSEAFAYSVNDVLMYRQGSIGIPKKLKELSKEFEKAITNENYEKARNLYCEMKELYGDDNSQVKSAKQDLEFFE